MKDYWKEWIHNKVYLLSTPIGAGVGITAFITGILLGQIILSIMRT